MTTPDEPIIDDNAVDVMNSLFGPWGDDDRDDGVPPAVRIFCNTLLHRIDVTEKLLHDEEPK